MKERKEKKRKEKKDLDFDFDLMFLWKFNIRTQKKERKKRKEYENKCHYLNLIHRDIHQHNFFHIMNILVGMLDNLLLNIYRKEEEYVK